MRQLAHIRAVYARTMILGCAACLRLRGLIAAGLLRVLQLGKQNVGISRLEPIGNYALRLHFDDGHNTGLFSWALLHELGRDRVANWARYQQRCALARAAK